MDAEAVLEELVAVAEPGLMPMVGPRFFAWVIGASHPAGVAADWLVSAWGQNAGYHSTAPAAAAIEETAERWLLDILDLPRESGIGFSTGATVANGTCLAAARTGTLLKAGWDPDADGLFGAPPVHVLIGADAHSSLFSSLQLIGFGRKRVITIATDDQGRMLPCRARAAITGLTGPKVVIAQAGQINTGAYDPFSDIVAIGKAHGAWVHVDGAFGLWARAVPELRHLTEGIEGCDCWVTDGHKWLQVPYDSGFAIVSDRDPLLGAMSQWSSYLPSIAQGDRVPSNYVPELSAAGPWRAGLCGAQDTGASGRCRAGGRPLPDGEADGGAAFGRAGGAGGQRRHHQPADRQFRHRRCGRAQGCDRSGDRPGAGGRRLLCRRRRLARRLGDAHFDHLWRDHRTRYRHVRRRHHCRVAGGERPPWKAPSPASADLSPKGRGKEVALAPHSPLLGGEAPRRFRARTLPPAADRT